MSTHDGGKPDSSKADGDALREAAAKRARLDRIFGDVLPETTSDERGRGGAPQDSEAWLRQNIPPHHG